MRTNNLAVSLSLAFILASVNITASAEKSTLNIYTYDSFASKWGPGPKVKAAFEAICDCTLSYISADSSTGILNRVQLEGNKSKADIVLGLDTSLMAQAQLTGLLAQHGADTSAINLPIDWQNDTFIPFDYGYFAFVYDESKLKTVPDSLDTLAASDIKVILQDPRSSTPGLGLLLWVQAVKGEQAAAWWQAMADNVVTVSKGWSTAYGLFLEGEADMVLSYTTSPAYHQIAENKTQYKAAAFKEGHGMQIEVAAMLKTAPNPELAKQFMQFILSDAFQKVIPTGNWMYPVTDVELPAAFANLAEAEESWLIDSQTVLEHKKAWLEDFNNGLAH